MTDEPRPTQATGSRRIPPPVAKDLRSWKATARLLTTTHYVLGIVAIVSSVLASVKVDQPGWLKALSFFSGLIAAMCAGSVTFLKLEKLARAYRKAASRLHEACIEYQVDPKKTDADLVKAYKEAAVIKNAGDT